MWWILICIAIVAIMTIFIFKRMPIEIIYAASAKHKKQAFRVKVYNIDIIRDKSKKTHKNKKKNKEKNKKEFSFELFMERIKWIKDIYNATKDRIKEVFLYLGKNGQCKNFTIHFDIGFKNAAHTGIASGVAYGVVYGGASLVYNNIDIKKEQMDIEVNPRFDKECADLYIKSIFCISPAHIIRVVMLLLKINKQIKQIIKQ